MRLVLHHNKRQQASCLESLAEYAQEIARTAFARSFATLGAFVSWCRLQAVKEDCGESPQRGGCNPKQRSTVWPWNGLNCWEATAHFVGVAMALQPDVIVHVYDVDTEDGGRHVFPALQNALGGPEWEVVLQPSPRAQAWWNVVADVAHGLGGLTLGIFGAGALVPLVDMAWKQAPQEYGLTKYQQAEPPKQEQPSIRQAEIADLQKRLAALLAEEKKSSPPTSEGGSGRGSSSGSERGSRSQDTDRAVIEEGGMITEEAEAPKDFDAAAVDIGGGDFDAAAVDIGGGDFDAAAVDIGGGDFDAAAVDIGGGDFDAAAVEFDGE